jgi:CDP-diacylglycerol--glycerol-3-phosphate 3-phosphatidyltransferase/cardiolipin synthase
MSAALALLEPQNLLSAVRLPLAAAFAASVKRPVLAFGLLGAAAASDVADGWLARRRGRAGQVGAIIDPIADKAFALAAILALVRAHRVPSTAAALLLVREMVEAPLAVHRLLGRCNHTPPSANRRGKATTILQFMTLASSIAAPRALWIFAFGAAAAGLAAGLGYWARDTRRSGISPTR